MDPLELLWLIPVLPLAGAALNAVLGPRVPRGLTTAVALGAPGASLAVALAALWRYLAALHPQAVEQALYAWSAGPFAVDVAFVLDPLSAVMVFVVTFVGFVIHVYSVGYMAGERGYQRFFAYMNLFLGAMLLLVMGSNFLVMFVGWEGVGLCSYLLIGYFYEGEVPPAAGRKAFIVNRIGDFAFLVGMLALYERFGTLRFAEIFGAVTASPELATADYRLGLTFAGFVTLALFIGAVGKSAQIPLYVWLPDAMAGPTPVSALIHAATMVTAGVYMVARANALYQLAPEISFVVAVVGCVTAAFAATIGLAQTDIKRVLAYSTVSQLGYMFLAAGVGAYSAAIFHLGTHAFFKALLFLGSGAVIHAVGGEQDMRRMGGLRRRLPITYWTFLIAALAIAGAPGFAGFFSKDAILAAAWGEHPVLWVIALATAGLTACYIFRAVWLTFAGTFRGGEEQGRHVHEAPATMWLPLVVLAAGSIGAGWVGLPAVLGEDRFGTFLAPVVAHVGEGVPHHPSGAVEWALIAASVLVAGAGIAVAWAVWGRGRGLEGGRSWAERFPGAHRVLLHKYYVDELYDRAVVRPLAWLARAGFRVVDTLIIEGLLHTGALLTRLTGDIGSFSTTGNVRNYALYFFLGMVILFWWIIL